MKTLLLITIFLTNIYASMGDCFTCHPSLIKGIDSNEAHKPMLTSIKCHTPSRQSVLECGDKCFSCHKEQDLEPEEIPEHRVFEDCRECHVEAKKKLLDITNTHDQSHVDTLKDFLLQ
jgi:transcriptional accessory protein Tex/SPT6